MIKVTQVSKSYSQLKALDNVSFETEKAKIFGLLGPNGAGKSTIINCISGLVTADEGSIEIDGHNVTSSPKKAKLNLGIVPQDLALYEDLSAHENLVFWGSAYGLSGKQLENRIQAVLKDVGLESRQKEPVKNYSGGMKRRLNFACAILHEPKALLLDEPTVGVDPQSREHLLQSVLRLKEQGTSVIYTTHYMEEAERLSDSLAILDQGKVIAQGAIGELRQQVGEKDLIFLKGNFNINEFKKHDLSQSIAEISETEVQLWIEKAPEKLPEVLKTMELFGSINSVKIQQPSLESLFIKLTGRALRDNS